MHHPMLRVFLALLIGATVAVAVAFRPQKPYETDKPKQADKPAKSEASEKSKKLMRRKLAQSQKILGGLATNNFKAIEEGADELMTISKATEWRVLKTPKYEMYSNQFRRAAAEMAQNAQKKNIDAVALNYVDMTLTCVNCHKHVREVRRAAAPRREGFEYAKK